MRHVQHDAADAAVGRGSEILATLDNAEATAVHGRPVALAPGALELSVDLLPRSVAEGACEPTDCDGAPDFERDLQVAVDLLPVNAEVAARAGIGVEYRREEATQRRIALRHVVGDRDLAERLHEVLLVLRKPRSQVKRLLAEHGIEPLAFEEGVEGVEDRRGGSARARGARLDRDCEGRDGRCPHHGVDVGVRERVRIDLLKRHLGHVLEALEDQQQLRLERGAVVSHDRLLCAH